MNHDPFKINGAILDMWRDLKAGDDYIHRLEVRNAELVTANARLKAEVERLRKAGDAMNEVIRSVDHTKPSCHANHKMTDAEYEAVQAWTAAKEGKPSV